MPKINYPVTQFFMGLQTVRNFFSMKYNDCKNVDNMHILDYISDKYFSLYFKILCLIKHIANSIYQSALLIFIFFSLTLFFFFTFFFFTAPMGSPLEQLTDDITSEIFGKTKCAKSLIRCAKLEPLILNAWFSYSLLTYYHKTEFEVAVPLSSNKFLLQAVRFFYQITLFGVHQVY